MLDYQKIDYHKNAPDIINIRAHAEFLFAQNSLFGKVQQKVQIQ